MILKISTNKTRYDKGQVFPFLIAIIVVIVIIAMITVNLGQIGIFKTDVSNAADSAALAGASILSGYLLGVGLKSDMMAGQMIVEWLAIIFDIIAGVPSGGIPFGSVVAYKLHKPFIFARSTQKSYGRRRRVEGILNHGDRVLLLDDLITTGKSIVEVTSVIRAKGGIVKDAVALIDREEGGNETLVQENLELHSLLKISEVAAKLHAIGIIDEEKMKVILEQVKTK